MTHTDTEPVDADALDEAWLAAPRRRSRPRVAMVVALAVLLVFLGGVEVQKHWGASDAAAGGGRPTGLSLPGGGSFPTGGLGGTQAQTGSNAATATPAVIGRVVGIHGHTWIVQDLGGTKHTVTLTDRTTLTRSLKEATGPVRTGSSVTVQGTTHGGTVAATAITVR